MTDPDAGDAPNFQVTLSVDVGILTLLNQVPVPLALAHQAVAIVVLTLAVFQAERLVARPHREPRNLGQPLAQTG